MFFVSLIFFWISIALFISEAEFVVADYPRLIFLHVFYKLWLNKEPCQQIRTLCQHIRDIFGKFVNTSFAARVMLFQWDAVNVNCPLIGLNIILNSSKIV